MYGGEGNDELAAGGAGWDLLSGQAGNDRLLARDGIGQFLDGGDGDDSAKVDEQLDQVISRGGTVTMSFKREPIEFEPMERRWLCVATLVRDIGVAADPRELVDVQGTLFFTADNGRHGRELWKSDGTAEGTERVADIFPGGKGSAPQFLTAVAGNVLYFTADDGVHGRELWKSDGTAAGTMLVDDITPGPGGSTFGQFTASFARLFFTVNGDLWLHSLGETREVLDIFTESSSEGPYERITSLTPDEVTGVYFVRDHLSVYGLSYSELWRTIGVTAQRVLQSPGIGDSFITALAVVNQQPFYSVEDEFDNRLWGHYSGMVHDGSFIQGLTPVGDLLYFLDGGELWRTDGFAGGTILLNGDVAVRQMANVNGTLFFLTDGGVWTSDGTVAGTRRVKDLRLTDATGNFVYGPMTAVGDTLFFTAGNDGTGGGRELWSSDGTAAGTRLVKDIQPGPNSAMVADLTAVDRTLFFTADDGTHSRQLWVSSAEFAALDHGVLTVEGTDANDTISVTVRESTLRVWRDGQTLTFPLGAVQQISIDALGGDDVIDWSGTSIPGYCLGGFGNDLVTAGLGSDTLSGSAGKDTLFGGGGDDYLSGGGTNDRLYGESGRDHLTGGASNDQLFGGPHDDRLFGDDGDDLLSAGSGRDTLYGGVGNDELTAGAAGWDLLSGQQGNDRLLARDGIAQFLDGGDGDDTADADELLDSLVGVEDALS